MADPLLSSLCNICHTNTPKYTCPRCGSKTCSLACSKRHKLWASCNGVRDPTVYVPRHKLATAAGIDHDYNFISSIERSISRSDKKIVEERGLFSGGKELFQAGETEEQRDIREARTAMRGGSSRGGRGARGVFRGRGSNKPLTPLDYAFRRTGVDVRRAPRGMMRKVENNTHWSNKQRCVTWTIEWITISDDGSNHRHLGNCLDRYPIGKVYAETMQEEKLKGWPKPDRKRYREEELQQSRKRQRLSTWASSYPLSAPTVLQNPNTSCWNLLAPSTGDNSDAYEIDDGLWKYSISHLHFYLLLPHTPATLPKVLIPLAGEHTLEQILQNRTVLEYPTIYALQQRPEQLGNAFLSEAQYLNRRSAGRGNSGLVAYDSGDSEDEEDDDDDESSDESGEVERSGPVSDETTSSEEEDDDDGEEDEGESDSDQAMED